MHNETVYARRRPIPGALKKQAGRLALRLLPVVLGFALARTGILGRNGIMKGIYPFGASFAVAAPPGTGAAAIAGILLGFILPGNDADTLRCAASALAAAGIKWALAEFRPVKESPFFPPAAALAGVVLTGMVVSSSVGAVVGYDLAAYLAEGAMAAAGAYFFCGAVRAWNSRRERSLSARDIYCMAAALCVAAIPLCRITIFGFSPATAAVLILIPAAASRLGPAGGSAAGISLGVVLALADGRFALAGIIAIAGLVTALFSPLGPVAASASFFISCTLGVLASGEVDIYLITETALAAVAYSIISIKPERLNFLFDILEPEHPQRLVCRSDTVIFRRLTDAARGLEEVSRTVAEVSERLERVDAPAIGVVCRQATDVLCADCAISGFCWNTSRQQTQRLFDSLSEILRRDGRLTRKNTPEPLRARCARWGEMAEEINARYAEYSAGEGARRRISQTRQAVAGQLSGCGALLSELAEDGMRESGENDRLSRKAAEALAEYEVPAEDVSCRRRPDGSAVVSMTLRINEDWPEPELAAAEILAEELEMSFSPPRLTSEGGSVRVEMESCPEYRLSVGICQHARGGGRLCGDACRVEENINGSAFVLLSDGMGTGGRAAVDAAMTCDLMRRLLAAGFGEKGAVELVNSALQLSSGEEELVTLDCARLDLYSGRLTISKAGAVSSYILKEGEVEEIGAESLPLGIMERADSRSAETALGEGDVVVMVTDGAAAENGWIARELEGADTADMERLARDIVALAAARCAPGEDDDITAVAFRVDRYEAEREDFQAA